VGATQTQDFNTEAAEFILSSLSLWSPYSLLCELCVKFYFLDDFVATQPRIPSAGTTKGNIPYKVSLAECERRSTAMNTCTQIASVNNTPTHPFHAIGK
jgi:hypothetical protein